MRYFLTQENEIFEATTLAEVYEYIVRAQLVPGSYKLYKAQEIVVADD